VLLDTGAFGLGVISIERFARESGIELGDPGPGGLYQVVAEEISLGDAVGRCPLPPDLFAFEVIGAFAHDFYKPFAVTFDFVDMNPYITEALMSGSAAWLPGHRGGRCVVRGAAVG
jgi:hypothetical protein